MTVKELDITPAKDSAHYKKTLMNIEKSPFAVEAFNNGTLGSVSLLLDTIQHGKGAVQVETSIYIPLSQVDSVIELLQAGKKKASIPYKDKKN